MTKIQKKFFSAIATSALLFNSVVGAVFAQTTTLTITGNGADSENSTNVGVSTTTTVVQTNTANITNSINSDASTGGNEADKNTGGDVTVKTGDASTGVSVSNTANSNVADVNGCCATNTSVEISGNGADTENTANLGLTTSTGVYQTNEANIKNTVYADSSTGDNEAKKNTGGDVLIWTGDADSTVLVDNKANSNVARIGGGEEGSGSISLKILGNGADSDNAINLGFERSLSLVQDNYANIKNKVDANAETGYNDAKENTGGDVVVKTGDASAGVGIDNMANFNAADLSCGCLLDVLAKVAGNGADSDNTINAGITDAKEAFQTNDYSCGYNLPELSLFSFPWYGSKKACNDVEADASTGDNNVKESTSWSGGDPMIDTGDAATLTEVSTTANANVLNDGGTGFDFPTFDFGFDFGGSNWALWWGWLVGHSS